MSEWTETPTGTRISKKAKLLGTNTITIGGNCTINNDVIIHGEHTFFHPPPSHPHPAIQIGKFTYLGPGTHISPPLLTHNQSGQDIYSTQQIGSYVIIGAHSTIKLTTIGNRVLIEEGCTLKEHSIVYECCIIRQGCTVPAKMVIPAYCEVSGTPGRDFRVKSICGGYKRSIEMEAKLLRISS